MSTTIPHEAVKIVLQAAMVEFCESMTDSFTLERYDSWAADERKIGEYSDADMRGAWALTKATFAFITQMGEIHSQLQSLGDASPLVDVLANHFPLLSRDSLVKMLEDAGYRYPAEVGRLQGCFDHWVKSWVEAQRCLIDDQIANAEYRAEFLFRAKTVIARGRDAEFMFAGIDGSETRDRTDFETADFDEFGVWSFRVLAVRATELQDDEGTTVWNPKDTNMQHSRLVPVVLSRAFQSLFNAFATYGELVERAQNDRIVDEDDEVLYDSLTRLSTLPSFRRQDVAEYVGLIEEATGVRGLIPVQTQTHSQE